MKKDQILFLYHPMRQLIVILLSDYDKFPGRFECFVLTDSSKILNAGEIKRHFPKEAYKATNL